MLQLQLTVCACRRGSVHAGSVTAAYSNVLCLDYLSQGIMGRARLRLARRTPAPTSEAITRGGKQSQPLMAHISGKENTQSLLTVITTRMKERAGGRARERERALVF